MSYFLGKLSDILFRINIHEGTANERLASESKKIIVQLATNTQQVPTQYLDDFQKLIKLIEKTLKKHPNLPLLTPCGLSGIQNRTASRYIKLLLDIQNELESKI